MFLVSSKPRFKMVSGSLCSLAVVVLAVVACAAPEPDPSKPHHTADGFTNVYPHDKRGFWDFWRWQWERLPKAIPAVESYDFPRAEVDLALLHSNHEQPALTWIGHATVLLQIGPYNILTDPQFSERASPIQWAGPKRAVPPVPALEALPPIDAVLISHNHYDSLDVGSIEGLVRRPGGEKTVFYVPLGLKAWFEDLGVERVVELDWWERVGHGDLEVIAVPVQHWSKRTFFDRNETLWAGWAVVAGDFRFLFAGDSGYTPHFREIGERLGPFDLAAIPIGAYEPRWFMRPHHVNPQEAVQIHLDSRSQKSVAIHWGTFILSDEPLDEPPRRLAQALRNRALPPSAFVTLRHGETLGLDVGSWK